MGGGDNRLLRVSDRRQGDLAEGQIMITITLQQILAAGPCYDPIAKYGLKEMDRDAPISFQEIAEMAGVRDAIWCFAKALPGYEALKRHFAVDCAERVRHLMEDPRSLAALKVARRHALGQATDEELALALADAWAIKTARATEAIWAAEAAVWAAAEAVWNAAAAAEAAAAEAAEAEIRWQGQRLIEITEAGAWTPVEEADKRGWSHGH